MGSRLAVSLSKWRDGALPAHLFYCLEAGAIHAGARRIGLVGDSWAILLQAARGWDSALATPLGYHYIPVALGWTRLLYLVFGDREPLYAVANVAQLTLVAWLTFLLGRRLLGRPLPGLLAGALLIGSAAFPDITYWVVVGNFHSLSLAFSILAVAAAFELAEEAPPRRAAWVFAAALAGAIFAYEGTLVILAVGILWVLGRALARQGMRGLTRPALLGDLFRRFAPTLAVMAAWLFSQARFAVATGTPVAPRIDEIRLHSAAHALLGIFTLRGSFDVLESLLAFGRGGVLTGLAPSLGLIVLAVAASVWCSRRGGLGVRLLLLWFWLYLAIAAVGLPLAPRHRFMPSVPGLLLFSFALCQGGEWLATRIAKGSDAGSVPPGAFRPATVALGVPLTVALVLLLSAQGELRRAQELYRRSSGSMRLAVEQARAALPSRRPPAVVTLVDAPAHWVEGGITVPAFGNALEGIAFFRLPGARLELVRTRPDPPGWMAVPGSPRVDAEELRRLIADPSRTVVVFDRDPEQVHTLLPAEEAEDSP